MRYAGELICETLEQLGAQVVFGLPGTQNVPLFEALAHSNLRAIVTSHEMGALFAANGYYRGSGKVGVATTIPGPGFTFALTGLAEAHLDSSAILLLVPSSGDGSDRPFQHQHIDMATMARPVVKDYLTVSRIDELAETVARGYRLALSGEPGPVVVEFSSKLFGVAAPEESPLSPSAKSVPDSSHVDAIARLLADSHRPLIFAGQGAHVCSIEIAELVSRIGAVVTTTNSGRGVLPESDPRVLYYDFSYGGGETLNKLIEKSDLVLVLGAKLSHNGSGGFKIRIPQEKLVHIDASRAVLNANYPAKIALEADLAVALPEILKRIGNGGNKSEWGREEIAEWRHKLNDEQAGRLRLVPTIQAGKAVSCSDFFKALRSCLSDDCCMVTDSGLHQVLTRSFFSVNAPRGMITPSDFQSMGFGLPAAIGARMAQPNRQVVVVIGDGGMAMSGMELVTAVREKLQLTVIIFNDGYLNLIRQRQIERGQEDKSTSLQNPDFATFAESIGAGYFQLTDDISDSIHTCLQAPGTNILEIFLQDPSGMARKRLEGKVRRRIRHAVHRPFFSRLKSILGR